MHWPTFSTILIQLLIAICILSIPIYFMVFMAVSAAGEAVTRATVRMAAAVKDAIDEAKATQ